MSNVFPTHVDIHRTYDLKGSTFGRFTSKEEIEKNQNAVLKDQNWLEQSQKIHLGPKKRELFLAQLERDVEVGRASCQPGRGTEDSIKPTSY